MPHVEQGRIEQGRIVETAVEARGAVRGLPVLYMLLYGTAGTIVLFVAVYMYFFA
jgi:hypothetical protein